MTDIRNKEILRTNIRRLRMKQKITQAALAELVGVEPKHISCIESGVSFPSFDLISRLADAFKIELYELFLIDKMPSKKILTDEINKMLAAFPEEDIEKVYLYCKFISG